MFITISIFIEATGTTNEIREQIIPITVFLIASIIFLSMNIIIHFYNSYDVSVNTKEVSYYKVISINNEDGVRITTEREALSCIITYEFDKLLVIFEKSDVVDKFDKGCDEIGRDMIEAKRLKYLKELNR